MARMIDAPAFLDEETKKEPAVHACETDSPVVAAMAAVHNAMTKLQEAVSGLMDRESNLQIQIESLQESESDLLSQIKMLKQEGQCGEPLERELLLENLDLKAKIDEIDDMRKEQVHALKQEIKELKAKIEEMDAFHKEQVHSLKEEIEQLKGTFWKTVGSLQTFKGSL